MIVLAQGFAIGFLIAAPVGPIGLLCIRRTLQYGWSAGFASGLGVAIADGLYAAVAAFGLTAVVVFLQQHARAFHTVSAVLLVLLGVQAIAGAFRPQQAAPANAEMSAQPAAGQRLAAATISTLALTLVNPATVLSFAAAFTLITTRIGQLSAASAAIFSVGAFCGSAAWWLVLASIVGAARQGLHPEALRWANVASGAGLIAFAAWVLFA